MHTVMHNWEARADIALLQDFRNRRGTFTAHRVTPANAQPDDKLPEPVAAQYVREVEVSGEAYVVFSYSTPIGWYTRQFGWTVPHCQITNTTAKHQLTVRQATIKGAPR